ncbi:hypothetical protein [Azospirillum doebereinerae]|uniref:Uncharacterized protein n=1 Tax=Azospirillum doebereinerae TaxID=92933 RepID=A0A433JAT0_9PROT|nr:hypothetical protein [Azospirillum doebereinerae]RUQ72944.1 hypothetical protein EJ913_10315 [Azospirillum doebereinerae]
MPTDSETIAFAAPGVRRAIVYAALSSRVGANLGPQISQMDRQLYFNTAPLQLTINQLKKVLFPWMVLDFRAKPTKTKALCIFDMYLGNDDGKNDVHKTLRERMETVRQNSDMAKSMSWLKRVSTSSSRTVDSNIFDDMFRLHLFGSSQDHMMRSAHQGLFRQIIATPPVTSLSPQVSAEIHKIQQICKDAGFSLKNLGLTDSFA